MAVVLTLATIPRAQGSVSDAGIRREQGWSSGRTCARQAGDARLWQVLAGSSFMETTPMLCDLDCAPI